MARFCLVASRLRPESSSAPPWLYPPGQSFVKARAELEVVGGVDQAIAIEIEEGLVVRRFIERAAEGQIVAGVDDGLEVDVSSAAGRGRRLSRIAKETVEGCDRIGGHGDAGDAGGMDF